MRVCRCAYRASSSPASSCTATRARGSERVPGLAAELRERRRPAVGADVAGDLAELLVRDEQPVLAVELEVDVVARDARDGLRVEADEAADAVVVVHDVVARPQVGERGRACAPRRAGRSPAPLTRRRKTCWSEGNSATSKRRRDEAPAGARDDEVDAGLPRQRLVGAEQPGLDAAQRRAGRARRRRGAGTRPRRGSPAFTRPRSSFSASARPRPASAGRCASNESAVAGSGSSRASRPRSARRRPSGARRRARSPAGRGSATASRRSATSSSRRVGLPGDDRGVGDQLGQDGHEAAGHARALAVLLGVHASTSAVAGETLGGRVDGDLAGSSRASAG